MEEALVALGFTQTQVRTALEITGNDPDAAAELLFADPTLLEPLKLVILVREDLGMSPGKVAAQVAHAALKAYRTAQPSILEAWDSQGQAIIVLKVTTLSTLHEVREQATTMGLNCNIIQDAGRTQVDPGTATVCALGPDANSRIDQLTSSLSLY